MKTTTLRLRRVRFRNGKTIEVLRPKTEDIAGGLTKSAASAVENEPQKIVGYALVAWRTDGEVFATYSNGERSPIIAGQVPQYVKDCLLADMAARWARD